GTRRSRATGALPPPRPRQQVVGGVRCCLHRRRHPDDPRAGPGAERERARGALDRKRPPRVSRPPVDRRPPPPRARPPGLRAPLQPPKAAPRAQPPAARRRRRRSRRPARATDPRAPTRPPRRPYPRVPTRRLIEFPHPTGGGKPTPVGQAARHQAPPPYPTRKASQRSPVQPPPDAPCP